MRAIDKGMSAWLWVVAWPEFWVLGYALAHLPGAVWPQYAGLSSGQPLWFGLVGTSLFLAAVESGGAITLLKARRAEAVGSRLGVAALWASVLYMALGAGLLLTSLALQWSSRG